MKLVGNNNYYISLKNIAFSNPVIKLILEETPRLKLKNWYLGDGCVSQTIWNYCHGFQFTANIKDYDLVYFDADDLSWEGENKHIDECHKIFSNIDKVIELKNQARVHLWYKDHFGIEIEPYKSVEDAILTWPTTATSLGVRIDADGNFKIYAPFGPDDLFNLVVRPNERLVTKDVCVKKLERWGKARPKLKIVPW